MSVRVSTGTPQLKWDTGVNNTYTICAWLRRMGNGNSVPADSVACYPAFNISNPGSGNARAHFSVRVSDGLWGIDRSADWDFSVFSPNISRSDEWVFGAIVTHYITVPAEKMGVTCYLGLRGAQKFSRIYVEDSAFNPNVVIFGVDDWGAWFNGEFAHIKVWDAVLTEQELRREMYCGMPITQIPSLKYYHACDTKNWHKKAVPWGTAPTASAAASAMGHGLSLNSYPNVALFPDKHLYECIDESNTDDADYIQLSL